MRSHIEMLNQAGDIVMSLEALNIFGAARPPPDRVRSKVVAVVSGSVCRRCDDPHRAKRIEIPP